MNAQDVLLRMMQTSGMVLKSYVGDLSDADLLRRPGPGCNHLAWQLGHLISSECGLLESVAPGGSAKLPDGFAAQHSKETVDIDDPAKFCTKDEYLGLFEKVNAATAAALAKTTAEDLDKPGPEHMRKRFPTVGSIYSLIAMHPMMHAGQVVPVRRALGKPVVI